MYQKILDEAMAELKEEMADGKGQMTDRNSAHLPSAILHNTFVQECSIDTDLSILIPDEYVENIGERISLYQQLDNSKTEDDLVSFESQLQDRFGNIPEQTKKLISVVRLRWLAVELGFEKLVLKNGKITAWFVSNQKSPYYQSELFSKILQFVQNNPTTYTITEREKKLTLKIEKVNDIDEAMKILKHMKI